jgi:hypothetical protein
MPLQGLPDFHAPLRGEGFMVFVPFESGGTAEHIASPDALALARGEDGSPGLRLELVRGPQGTRGVLEMAVAPRYAAAAALALARTRHPGATVRPAPFSRGFIRLVPTGQVPGMAPETLAALLKPVPLAWSGAEAARFHVPLGEEAAALVQGALEGGVFTFGAYAEVELAGVAPRLDARALFDPAALVEALVHDADEARAVSRQVLFRRFRDRPETVPLRLEGPGTERASADERAEVLTHFVCTRLARSVPAAAPSPLRETFVTLAPPDGGRGASAWDLSEPWEAALPSVLILHPLEEARRLAETGGAASLVRRTTVPALDLGAFRLAARANLPAGLAEVAEIAVQVHAPARRPGRGAIDATLRLLPPAFVADTALRFVSGEAPAYTWRADVVLSGGRVLSWGADPDAGMVRAATADLVVGPDELPARVVAVRPDPALLAMAELRCVCAWSEMRRGAPVRVARERTLPRGARDDTAAAAFLVPLDGADATLMLEARDAEGRVVALGPGEARGASPGLYSFPEYGPHQVEVEVRTDAPVLVELVAEDRPDSAAETLAFYPGGGGQRWGWMARSPFRPGFRWRARPDTPGAEPGAWATVQPPFRVPAGAELPRFGATRSPAGFDLSFSLATLQPNP